MLDLEDIRKEVTIKSLLIRDTEDNVEIVNIEQEKGWEIGVSAIAKPHRKCVAPPINP